MPAVGAPAAWLAQAGQVAQHMHHALAVLQRSPARRAASGFVLGRDVQAQHRQLDGVLLEAVDARETGGRQELPSTRRWVKPRGRAQSASSV
jgi:hypothetical protein